MTWETVALVALTLLALWTIYREIVKPKYAISVQKTVNVNEQPEVVTVQATCPRWARQTDVWTEVERCAFAAIERMQSVNEDIVEAGEREKELVEARREQRRQEKEAFEAERRRKEDRKRVARRIARTRGIHVRDVTDAMIDDAMAAKLEAVQA